MMTQDQYGQARAPGYVVRGDVVPDDETGESPDEQERPLTRFEKVASAVRGGGPERDEQDRTADQAATDETRGDQAAGEAPPRGDYWDGPTTPEAERGEAVGGASPRPRGHPRRHPGRPPRGPP